MKITLSSVVLAALVAASAAGGYVARAVTVRSGDEAIFGSSGWACSYASPAIRCMSGDAFPWVELTTVRCASGQLARCGVAVRVHRLRAPQGGTLRTVPGAGGNPVYVFTAF